MRGPASSTGEDQRPFADLVAEAARRGASSPDRTGRSSPRRRLARAPLVIGLLAWVLAGCSASDGAIPRDDVGSATAPVVRTDREPLAERFPELGSFGDPPVAAVWHLVRRRSPLAWRLFKWNMSTFAIGLVTPALLSRFLG